MKFFTRKKREPASAEYVRHLTIVRSTPAGAARGAAEHRIAGSYWLAMNRLVSAQAGATDDQYDWLPVLFLGRHAVECALKCAIGSVQSASAVSGGRLAIESVAYEIRESSLATQILNKRIVEEGNAIIALVMAMPRDQWEDDVRADIAHLLWDMRKSGFRRNRVYHSSGAVREAVDAYKRLVDLKEELITIREHTRRLGEQLDTNGRRIETDGLNPPVGPIHLLRSLWNDLKSLIEETDQDPLIEADILAIDALDPTGYGFRYDRNRDGSLKYPVDVVIDVTDFLVRTNRLMTALYDLIARYINKNEPRDRAQGGSDAASRGDAHSV